jgi:hypothetical protein
MKKYNILIYLILIGGAYFYFVSSRGTGETSRDQSKSISAPGANEAQPKPGMNDSAEGFNAIAPRDIPKDELPEDIRQAASRPESHNPSDLPPDLQEQLNAPPPELPEDLKRQLEMGPQELPPDLKAQLEGPPPPIPDDIKRALEQPPRQVTIDEVNNPPEINDEEVIE